MPLFQQTGNALALLAARYALLSIQERSAKAHLEHKEMRCDAQTRQERTERNAI